MIYVLDIFIYIYRKSVYEIWEWLRNYVLVMYYNNFGKLYFYYFE